VVFVPCPSDSQRVEWTCGRERDRRRGHGRDAQLARWGRYTSQYHGTETRDFRVHNPFLSSASPVFKDMFTLPQSSSSAPCVYLVSLDDPPRALELILRLIYPFSVPPATDDLTTLLEALNLADKYDIEAARSRLRSSLVEFAKTEPLRVYAIASRLGFEEEAKIASSHALSINLPALAKLPDEFRHISATEYHRLIHLQTRYREEAVDIAINSLSGVSMPEALAEALDALFPFGSKRANGAEATRAAMEKFIVGTIMKGTPLDYTPFTLALKTDYGIDVEAKGFGGSIRSVLHKTNALNLTV